MEKKKTELRDERQRAWKIGKDEDRFER